MEMAQQPDDGESERDDQHEEDDSAFAPFLPQGFPAADFTSIVSPPGVLQRDRNIESAAALACPGQQLFALPARRLLRHPRRFRDHALEFFHLAAQLRFALREFFLFLVERRPGLRRSAAHAELLDLRRDPKENEQRQDPENDQGYRHGETDLHPLHEGFATQARRAGSDRGQLHLA